MKKLLFLGFLSLIILVGYSIGKPQSNGEEEKDSYPTMVKKISPVDANTDLKGNPQTVGYIIRKDVNFISVITKIAKEEVTGKNLNEIEAYYSEEHINNIYTFNLADIDEETKVSLSVGQNVRIISDWIYLTRPGIGNAINVEIL